MARPRRLTRTRHLTEAEVSTLDQDAEPRADEAGDYDQAELGDVLQREDDDLPSVPVTVVGSLAVDELPTMLGSTRRLAYTAAGPPVKVLNSDPRRAALTLWCLSGDVGFARSQAEAQDVSTMAAVGVTPVRFTFTDELWIRPTGAAVLSLVVEQWTR